MRGAGRGSRVAGRGSRGWMGEGSGGYARDRMRGMGMGAMRGIGIGAMRGMEPIVDRIERRAKDEAKGNSQCERRATRGGDVAEAARWQRRGKRMRRREMALKREC